MTIRVLLICCLVLSLFGCATMTIEGDGQKPPKSEADRYTEHNSFYGFVWSEPQPSKCKNGHGIYRVRYHTNAAYTLATVLSLGLYVPQTVDWWCDGTPPPEEYEPEYEPAN